MIGFAVVGFICLYVGYKIGKNKGSCCKSGIEPSTPAPDPNKD